MAYEVTWVRPFSKRKGKTEQERFWWESCLSAFPSTTRRAAAVPPVCQAARTLAVTSRASLHQRSDFQPILNLHPQKGPSCHPQLHSPDRHSPLPPWSRHKVWIPSPTLTSPVSGLSAPVTWPPASSRRFSSRSPDRFRPSSAPPVSSQTWSRPKMGFFVRLSHSLLKPCSKFLSSM